MSLEWARALLGGVLIGSAAALLLLTHGRLAGISGLLGALLDGARGRGQAGRDTRWRAAFLAAMVAAGGLLVRVWPEQFATLGMPHWPVLIISGSLVGIGTRIGSGCTSGHGVCGIGRGSVRSIAATLTFMATAIVTVLLTRHLL